MKIITTQAELDKLKEIPIGQEISIEAELRVPHIIEVFGKLTIKFKLDCSWADDRYFRANSQPHIEAWENSHPHKIAFRKGTVLYECDRLGRKIKVINHLTHQR